SSSTDKNTGASLQNEDVMRYVFSPDSVAVIGASGDDDKEKSGWVGRLLSFDFAGKIYPINPRARTVLGLTAYPSVKDVPGPIDYVIMNIAREMAPRMLQECVDKGIPVVHMYVAGFAEAGDPEGLRLLGELKSILAGSNTRLIGPNCVGVYSPRSRQTFDVAPCPIPGPIAFISQTGTGARRLVKMAPARGLYFSKVVSFGNAMDLSGEDFLDHVAADPESKVVLLYIEGLKDGQRFFDTLRRATRVKPVILLAAGQSESGARAAASHTGSLAGNRQTWDALFRQSGAIRVETFEEALEQLVAVAILQQKDAIKGRRVGLVGRGGGLGVVTTDICDREGLKVPEFSKETQAKLAEITPSTGGSAIRNPVEIGLGRLGVSEHYAEGLRIVAADPEVDFIITFLNPEDYLQFDIGDWVGPVSKQLINVSKELGKPLVVAFVPGQHLETIGQVGEMMLKCQAAGIACFTSPEAAIKAISRLIKYREFLAATAENANNAPTDDVNATRTADSRIDQIIAGAKKEGRTLLTEVEAKEIFQVAGLDVVGTRLATSKQEAVAIGEEFGFPVALKIVSPDIAHKTDAGGVKLGLRTPQEVERAFEEIKASASGKFPQANIHGVSVQKMARTGVEVIIGMSRDRQFGPVLMFGLGGIFVEVLKDVSFGITPLTKWDAREMLQGIKGYALLKGHRGQEGVDTVNLESWLLKLSEFAIAHPEIDSFDLNPVIAYPDGATVVDARIILG
ncbi:MAG: acetate--CoA ligase family protein, partial [Dehalococcoidia bacterium]|nr:acetate--CoA ligase family protein [Dehalococcoidia bacterium]